MSELTKQARDSSNLCSPTSSQTIALLGGTPVAVATLAALAAFTSIAVAMLGLILCLAVVIAARHTSSRRAFHQLLARGTRHRARMQRERQRRRQLHPTGSACRHRYDELRTRIERVVRTGCPIARKLELDELLDHYVRTAVAHHRFSNAVSRSGDSDLIWPFKLKSGLRAQIVSRRVEHRKQCLHRVDELSDELDAIEELVGYVEQRSECPDLESPCDAELEWRLSRIDEIDSALDEISQRCSSSPQ